MGKGSVLCCSNFFDIVDLNRDVEASMEFFCSSVCFMWNGEPFSMVFFELTIYSSLLGWGTVKSCLFQCNNAEFFIDTGNSSGLSFSS